MTTTKTQTKYFAGLNLPGYLPAHIHTYTGFDSLEEARAAVVNEAELAADHAVCVAKDTGATIAEIEEISQRWDAFIHLVGGLLDGEGLSDPNGYTHWINAEEVPVFEEYQLPAHWASYLVNGDASGLESEEIDEIEAFCLREGLDLCVDAKDYEEFVAYPDYGMPGAVMTYVFPLRAEGVV